MPHHGAQLRSPPLDWQAAASCAILLLRLSAAHEKRGRMGEWQTQMRKVLVYDIAADSGGALSILNAFYRYVSQHPTGIHWYFMVSVAQLPCAPNITVIRRPSVKKSWFHRLWYDVAVTPALVKKLAPDVLFSMQNLMLPRTRVKQVVYMQQMIPFSDLRFSFRESKVKWFYQHILSKFIFASMRKAEKVVVQTHWVARRVAQRTHTPLEKYLVALPDVPKGDASAPYDIQRARHSFFYPSAVASYKNFGLLYEAVDLLRGAGVAGFEVLLTATEEQLAGLGLTKNDPAFRFLGPQPHEEILKRYQRTTLLFPSKLETLGLPLLEARANQALILAGDTPFGREALDGYPNARFFDVASARSLADAMKGIIDGSIAYDPAGDPGMSGQYAGWKDVVELLRAVCQQAGPHS